MPNIANNHTIEVRVARVGLRQHISRLNISESEFSRRCGVPQYTLSKFLNGHIKTITPPIKKALNYAKIGITYDISNLVQHPAILSALEHSWDGTEQGAQSLAFMIESMAPLLRLSRPT